MNNFCFHHTPQYTNNRDFFLLQRLRNLEFINLTGCHHLTDNCIKSLVTNLPQLAIVGFSLNKGITEAGILHLLTEAPALKKLDAYALKVSEEGKRLIDQIRTERKIIVIMNGLEEKDENGVKRRIEPCMQKGMM